MYSWSDKNNEREKILLSSILVASTILIIIDTFTKSVFTFDRFLILGILIIFSILLILSFFLPKNK